MENIIKIIIADDHALFRSGIISLLQSTPEVLVIGEVSNGVELISMYKLRRPDIVLVDISMPEMSGTEAVNTLMESGYKLKALFLSMHTGEEYMYHVLKAGGMGLISKNVLKGELLHALKIIYQGKKFFGYDWSEEKLNDLMFKYEKTKIKTEIGTSYNFTKREEEVLLLISSGLTSSEIAAKMGLSKRTIDAYRSSIMQKVNLKSLSELIAFSIRYALEKDKHPV